MDKEIILGNTSVSVEYLQNQLAQLLARQEVLEQENRRLQQQVDQLDTYVSIFRNSPHATLIVHASGVIVDISQAAEVLLATKKRQLVGNAFGQVLFPESRETFSVFSRNLFETKSLAVCQLVLLTGNGEPRKVKLEGALTPNPELFQILVTPLTENIIPEAESATEHTRRELEKTVRWQEAQIRSLINNTRDIMIAADAEGRIIAFNGALQQAVYDCRNRAVALGQNFFDLVPAERLDQHWLLCQRALCGERVTETISYTLANDEVVFYDHAFNPIWNNEGQVIGFSLCSRDVSEQKKADDSVMYRTNILNNIFQEAADAIFLAYSDSSIIMECNRRAVQLFEAEDERKLIGKYGPNLRRYSLPVSELLRINLLLEETGNWSDEVEYTTLKGRDFWGSIFVKRIRIEETNYDLIRVTDITDRRKAEGRTRQYYAQLKAIIESTQDVIFALDKNLCYTNFNTSHQKMMQRLYGVDIEIGKNALDYLRGVDDTYTRGLLNISRALKGEQFSIEGPFGEDKVCFEIAFNPIRDEKNRVNGVAVFVRDVTDRRLAAEKLLTSLREKEVLLSEVYHRVKNNLNVVISLLTLQANRTSDRQVSDALQDSRNRIYAMALVHEQLYRSGDVSRINTGEYIVSLSKNVREAYLRKASKVELRLDVDHDIFLPLDIAIPIGLILNELLTNSLKHAFPDETPGIAGISLKTKSGRGYQLSVWDNGIGFDFNNTLKDPYKKSLGLKIVEMLVEQLKGEIQFFTNLRDLKTTPDTRNRVDINFKYPRN